jgi:hypothetical protein
MTRGSSRRVPRAVLISPRAGNTLAVASRKPSLVSASVLLIGRRPLFLLGS